MTIKIDQIHATQRELIKVLRDLVSTVEATGGLADPADGDGVAADPEWYDLRLVYEDAKDILTRMGLAIVLLLLATATSYAQSSQTATASAYGRQGCRAALLNVSRVTDGLGAHTWLSYTIWTCAAGSTEPEQVQSQQNGVLIPDGQFAVGLGGQSWRLNWQGVTGTVTGTVSLTWVPDGRSRSTYDATWTSVVAGQQANKTVRSLDTQSANTIGVLFGLSPDGASGTVMRGSDVTR